MKIKQLLIHGISSSLLISAQCQVHAQNVKQRSYFVQVGSFASLSSAKLSQSRAQQMSDQPGRFHRITRNGQILYRVQLGPFVTKAQARAIKRRVASMSPHAFIVTNKWVSPAATTTHRETDPEQSVVATPITNTPPLALETSTQAVGYERFPYPARAYADGSLSDNTSFFEGQMLLPLFGNDERFVYSDVIAKLGEDKAWVASVGSGARVQRGDRIWGAYAFIDRNVSPYGNTFWVASPGLEFMTRDVDAHLNAYFPVSSKKQFVKIAPASSFGYRDILASGHGYAEQAVRVDETVGVGVDGEVGYTLEKLNNTRVFVGGYHFSPKDSRNITGIEGGIEFPVSDHFSLLIRNAYDDVQKNSIMGTLRLTIGERVYDKKRLKDRMLDPVRRGFGSLQNGSGIPYGQSQLLFRQSNFENVWFFDPAGTTYAPIDGLANCTFENPCATFTQAAIDGIQGLSPQAIFFIDSGDYNNPLVGNGFSLYDGQNIRGRTAQFTRAASGNDRPLLNDTLLLSGNNSVNNVRVEGQSLTGGTQSAVTVLNGATGDVMLTNSHLSTAVDGLDLSITTLNNLSSRALTVESSDLVLSAQNGLIVGSGVSSNGGDISLNNSRVTIVSDNLLNGSGIFGAVNTGAAIHLNNSQVSITTNNSMGAIVDGIVISNSDLTLSNSQVTIDAVNNNQLTVNNIASQNGTVSLSGGSQLNTLASDNNNSDFTSININNSSLEMSNSGVTINESNNTQATITGILGSNNSKLNLSNNSTVDIVDTGNSNTNIFGIDIKDSSLTTSNNVALSIRSTDSLTPTVGSLQVISTDTGSSFNITNTSLTIDALNTMNFIDALDLFSGGTISNSMININLNNAGTVNGAFGIDVENTTGNTVNVQGVTINLSGVNSSTLSPIANLVGVANTSTTAINLQDTQINVTGSSPTNIHATQGANINNQGNSTCTTVIDGVTTSAQCPTS